MQDITLTLTKDQAQKLVTLIQHDADYIQSPEDAQRLEALLHLIQDALSVPRSLLVERV